MPTVTLPAGDVSLLVHYRSRALDPGADQGKPTLIFAHGFPDTHTTWSAQLDALQDEYHVAAFDLRGAGGSSAPKRASGYRIERILPDFDAVIDWMVGPAGKVHLIGHDWGGVLGWRYVSDPHRAGRLISYTGIAAPHPDVSLQLIAERLKSLDPGQWREVALQGRQSWYIGLFQLPLLPELVVRLAPETLWRWSHRQGGILPDDPLLKADRDEILTATLGPINLYRQLQPGKPTLPPAPIQVPCCQIIPDQDLALRPSIYASLARYVTRLEVHHLDANHWVHRSHPQLVNDLIRQFIQALPD